MSAILGRQYNCTTTATTMTATTATPCFSLFSEENKFSFHEINGGMALPVTAFILDPVVAVAVVEESEYDSDESEDESGYDSEDTIDEMLAIRQIVTRVEREPLEPEEEKENYESDDEVFLLRRNEEAIDDDSGDGDSADEEEEESDDEDSDQAEVDAALSSIAEYEDDKFKELVENIKKTKLFKDAKLIDDAEVRVDLGWTSMILYIR